MRANTTPKHTAAYGFVIKLLTLALTIAAVCMPVSAAAASAQKTVPINLAKKEVNKSVNINVKYQLKPTQGKKAIRIKDARFRSSAPKVAKVNKKGILTPKSIGKTDIVITVRGRRTIVHLKVVRPVKSLSLNKTVLNMQAGQTKTLKANIKPAGAAKVRWSSSDPQVATVSGGVVQAKKSGTATIYAKAGAKAASCVVVVPQKGSLRLKPNTLTITVGETVDPSYTIHLNGLFPADAYWKIISGSDVIDISNRKDIFEMTVTAKKIGNAQIGIYLKSDNSLLDTLKINCVDPKSLDPNYVTIDGVEFDLHCYVDRLEWLMSQKTIDAYTGFQTEFSNTLQRPGTLVLYDANAPIGEGRGDYYSRYIETTQNWILAFFTKQEINPEDVTWKITGTTVQEIGDVVSHTKNEIATKKSRKNTHKGNRCYALPAHTTDGTKRYLAGVNTWYETETYSYSSDIHTFTNWYPKYNFKYGFYCSNYFQDYVGDYTVSAYYKGKLIRSCKIHTGSTLTPAKSAYGFRKELELIKKFAWNGDYVRHEASGDVPITANSSAEDKVYAISRFIDEHYNYRNVDCIVGANILAMAARDLGFEPEICQNVQSVSGRTDNYISYHQLFASTAVGHTWVKCTTDDGRVLAFDANGNLSETPIKPLPFKSMICLELIATNVSERELSKYVEELQNF